MRKRLLLSVTALIALLSVSQAQIVNGSFETWDTTTTTFGVPGFIPNLTYDVPQPVDWSSSDQFLRHDSLAGDYFVTQDMVNFVDGASSVKMITTSFTLDVGFPISVIVPGILGNGSLDIDPVDLIIGGATFNPFETAGTGHPISGRASKISGYFNYAPLGGDSCTISAALVNNSAGTGREVVAVATFNSSASTFGFEYFEAEFNYTSCTVPDTVVFFSTSGPLDLGGGASGTVGTTLWLDSIDVFMDASFNLAPFAMNDSANAIVGGTVNVDVQANDEDCEGDALTTLSIPVSPANGTATIETDNTVTYEPSTGFTGSDNFIYEVCDGGGCDRATVYVDVATGIVNPKIESISIYPNPASDVVMVKTGINETTHTISLLTVEGRVINSIKSNAASTELNISNVAEGFYLIEVKDANGATIQLGQVQVVE